MEKLIYVMVDGNGPVGDRVGRIADATIDPLRRVGATGMAILVPDRTEEIRARGPGRIGGDFDRIAAAFECWLPTVDLRDEVERALRPLAGGLWGYLVTESTMAPCPYDVGDGERVPGITQWGVNDKPAHVGLDDFHREWAVHSKLSFDLHPTRDSYVRNAVARKLVADAPTYLGVVLERFPALDDFVDESIYFGDAAVVKEMIEHVPSFYDFATAITGGMSEYRWR